MKILGSSLSRKALTLSDEAERPEVLVSLADSVRASAALPGPPSETDTLVGLPGGCAAAAALRTTAWRTGACCLVLAAAVETAGRECSSL